MIRLGEIEKLSVKFGVPAEVIEKDYCINWLLIALSSIKEKSGLVFYGGTAIKMAYFPVYRFSEDIDFISPRSFETGAILSLMEQLYGITKEKANIIFSTDTKTVEKRDARLQFLISYDGFPELSFNKRVKLDFAFEVTPVQDPVLKKVSCSYSDMENISAKLPVYTLEAITTDKIGTLLSTTRTEPRDLYDLWFLLKSGRLDLNKVKANFKIKFGYILDWRFVIPALHNLMYKERWAHRLLHQVARLPDFNVVLNETEQYVRKYF